MRSGIVFDIKRFALHDGPGIRTTIFLKGCPLCCPWCHNPEGRGERPLESIKSNMVDGKEFNIKETTGKNMTVEEVIREVKKERMLMEESGGGVTFSGGEPLLQTNFLLSLLRSAKQNRFHTAVDTSGYATEKVIVTIEKFTDLFLFDLKIIDDQLHKIHTGVSNKLILENFIKIIALRKPVRVRVPVIPQLNDNRTRMEEILSFIRPFKKGISGVDLLPYHAIGKNKYKRFEMKNKFETTPSMNKNDVENFKHLFENEGFVTRIGG